MTPALRRSPEQLPPQHSSCILLLSSSLRELADQVEDRHLHRDDDAADNAPRTAIMIGSISVNSRNRGIDFLVEVRDLREHRVERARRFRRR